EVASQVGRVLASLRGLPIWQNTQCIDITFDQSENLAAFNDGLADVAGRSYWAMPKDDYPLLATHFSVIRTRRSTRGAIPVVYNSLDHMCVMNEPEIARSLVQQKVSKSMGRARGGTFWLVVHSDNEGGSSFTDRADFDGLLDAARGEFEKQPTAFTAA